MAHSKVSICNQALGILCITGITALTKANKQERACEALYDGARTYLLSKFDWPFAKKFVSINEVDTTDMDVPANFRVFELPNDCLNPRDLYPEGGQDTWTIMGNQLYTTKADDSLYLYYTANIVDTNLFSEAFVNLLAQYMAVKLCPSLTQDKKLAAQLAEQFRNEQHEAWESDANAGNIYKRYDNTPDNDTFVSPGGSVQVEEGNLRQQS